MTETKATSPITEKQYRALQNSIELPTPQELFDFMIERLRIKFEETDIFSYKLADPFHAKIGELGGQLFLVVPAQPKTFFKDRGLFEHVISLVENHGATGTSGLDPKELEDLTESPTTPTLLTDIEDGRMRLHVSPQASRQGIIVGKRHPYTIWRGLIHAIVFPEVFQDHHMSLVESQSKSGRVPCLHIVSGLPRLSLLRRDEAFPRLGAPSCGGVLTES